MSMAPDDHRHGTYNGYHNLGCRCEPCRAAGAAYHHAHLGQRREWRHRTGRNRPRDVYLADVEAQHGTESRYSRGCRCHDCRLAANAERRRRRSEGSVLTHNRSGYTNGCRCDVCREAHRIYSAERRARA